METIRIITLFFICLTVSYAKALTIQEADKYYDEYRASAMNGSLEPEDYDIMYKAYTAYTQVIKPLSSTSQDFYKCKSRLLDIFPRLAEAASVFTQLDQKERVIQFAQAYVDMSLMYIFADENLKSRPEYPVISYFAAYWTCMAKNYEDAIKYYQAYLETGDEENNEDAYQGLTFSFMQLYNYDNAKYIASQAIEKYPYNWSILYAGVLSSIETKDDKYLALFLDNAIKVKPKETQLVKYLAEMFERQKKYDEALVYFQNLYEKNPTDVYINCHLGFDNYNEGVVKLENAQLMASSSEATACRRQAEEKFKAALPYLQDVFGNYPWAANVAHAIAMCYNVTSDKAKLDEANADLITLKAKPVKMGEAPTIEQNYKPEAKIYMTTTTNDENFVSSIDENIPETKQQKENMYAIIIGNEHYKNLKERNVEFANNDANSFAKYCQKTLGIPPSHIRLKLDASLGEISEQISFIRDRSRMAPGELSFLFYYAGHGLPDFTTGDAYMLPSDATGSDLRYCYSLDKLYKELDESQAKDVVVFLDACFSGATRDGGMVLKERYVELEPIEPEVQGKTVIFSATSGKQTAMPYDDEHHGFFTFFLLQNLQQSNGAITLSDLASKLSKQVDAAAYDKKTKHQNPQVKTSPTMGDSWKSKSLLNL